MTTNQINDSLNHLQKSKRRAWIKPTILSVVVGVIATFSTSCAQSTQSEIKKIENVSYVPDSQDVAQTLDLWVPAGKATSVPLIVFIHGGGWVSGNKDFPAGPQIASKGFAFASINYRLTDEAKFPAQIYDCKAAIRWLRAHAAEYNINPDKIGVWGMSAGGHLAALLGTTGNTDKLNGKEGNDDQRNDVQAVCDWSGPTDMLTLIPQCSPDNPLHPSDPNGILAKFLGGLPEAKPDVAKEASPITYVSAKCPPFLIMHGSIDDIVPVAQSQEFYKALQENHVDSHLITLEGAKHSLPTEAFAPMLEFFEKNLQH